MLHCQCQYSDSLIIDDQLFCVTKNDVIYQAKLLSTDGKTALEIRNITQQWVLSSPTIMIGNLSYQVDPYCSTVVKELGATSCHMVTESQPDNQQPTVSESQANNQLPAITTNTILVSVVIVGMILLCVGLIILSLCYLHIRKSKSHDVR